jgi:hypothetical protein
MEIQNGQFFKYGIGTLMILMFQNDLVITANKEDIQQRPAYELNKLLIDYNFNTVSLTQKKIKITKFHQICEAIHRTQKNKTTKNNRNQIA